MQRQCQVCPTEQHRTGEIDWSLLDVFFVGGVLPSSGANVPKLPSFSEEPSAGVFRTGVPSDGCRRGSGGSCMEVVRFDSHDVIARKESIPKRILGTMIHQVCAVPRVRSSQQALTEEEEQAREGSADQSPEGTSVQGTSRVDRATQQMTSGVGFQVVCRLSPKCTFGQNFTPWKLSFARLSGRQGDVVVVHCGSTGVRTCHCPRHHLSFFHVGP